MVKICIVCFLAVSTLLHGTEPPGLLQFEDSLYSRFMQPFRGKVQEIGSFNGELLQVYEHLDPTRKKETRTYLRYASLSNSDLVRSFIDNFLEVSDDVDEAVRDALSKVVSKVISRDVGRLEIELLMTKMTVRRSFWGKVKTGITTRMGSFSDAVKESANKNRDKGASANLLEKSHLVDNMLKILSNPEDPNSVNPAGYDSLAGDFWKKFYFDGDAQINAFLCLIKCESSWGVFPAVGNVTLDKYGATSSALKVIRLLRQLDTATSSILRSLHMSALAGDKNAFGHSHVGLIPAPVSVKIKFGIHNKDGIVLEGGHYCYIPDGASSEDGENRGIGAQQKTLHGSMFHELGHALRWFEGRSRNKDDRLSLMRVYHQDEDAVDKWSNDEELSNIVGLSYSDGKWVLDPVSCAAFCRSEVKISKNFNVRCLHIVPPPEDMGASVPPERIPATTGLFDKKVMADFFVNIYG
ncbi:MAG: hypothetical protein LBJ96_04800 [Holosporaceae bacterium]|jgi:hypothetical protein|nr:hypothetical protein [Holosporaceae bacterium]